MQGDGCATFVGQDAIIRATAARFQPSKSAKVVILEKFLMSEDCDETEDCDENVLFRADSIRQLARYLFHKGPVDASRVPSVPPPCVRGRSGSTSGTSPGPSCHPAPP